jgi:uncharacterized membrane protein YdjX (TVP38/TMEM64 family)
MRRLVIAAAVLAAAVAAIWLLPVGEWSARAVSWVRDAGALGVIAYAVLYVGATVALLPGSVLTAGAGFAYGPFWGVVLVAPVATVAATCAFLVARTVGRGWVERRVARDERFGRLQRAVARRGLRLVTLVRLSPVLPFNLLNYALGLTGVRLRDYVLGSLLGMLPGTILYVYLGSLVPSVSQLAAGDLPGGDTRLRFYAAGLVASVVLVVIVTRMARKALREEDVA